MPKLTSVTVIHYVTLESYFTHLLKSQGFNAQDQKREISVWIGSKSVIIRTISFWKLSANPDGASTGHAPPASYGKICRFCRKTRVRPEKFMAHSENLRAYS